MHRSKVAGVGSFLPEKVLTNHDLEKMVETSHDWIVQRTGIERRHVIADGDGTSDMCVRAAQRALEDAKISVDQLDLIIVATLSGDYKMPATACLVQSKLGAKNIMAFDLNAACSGFVYSLHIADQFIKTGVYKNILIVGAETLTRMMNYQDRETCILFGDGAGAFVITRADESDKNVVMTSHTHAEGSLYDLLWVPAGGALEPYNAETATNGRGFMRMKGKEIFKNATRAMASCCNEALEATATKVSDLDWIVPHQANLRITEAVSNYFDFPMDKIISSVHETGNTSAASIPIAFDMAYRDGRIKRGQLIMLTAFGAGLTSGSALLRF
ncbi:beta-ketoacyl-ACP synthase III [Pseudobdellovibrio exovorus]|uniref:Beta-ketoacyl-[acyl-carrier-protein] synthase III n=1 Tax=Pseudobdellovibrio exovorus JSS TaxID=1184267 RepID=M4VBZ3_9BACT|nr:beta-ketoacyl-ACP synthase III [Pseudobdellovibrio exovorus]AGH95536.1 3-oxoacyl-(acyl-carrier-protein) synthase III [Pseudobdellovibrio exovorus JSS]